MQNLKWIVAWSNAAERVIKAVRKGKLIAIEGTLRNNDWTDKEGKRRTSTEIWLKDLYPLEFDKQPD